MTRQQMLDSYRKLVIAKQDAAHMMSADDHDAMFSQTLQAKAKSTLTAMNAPMRALLEEISDPRTFMIIQRYYVKGLTDQAIGREMNLTGARVNQIRLGYVRSLTNQASKIKSSEIKRNQMKSNLLAFCAEGWYTSFRH